MSNFDHYISQGKDKSLSTCINGDQMDLSQVCLYQHGPLLKKINFFKQWAIDGIYSPVCFATGLISSVP